MVKVGEDLWRSSAPTLLLLEQVTQDHETYELLLISSLSLTPKSY